MIALASMKAGIHTPITFDIRSYKDLEALTEGVQKNEDKGFYGVTNAGLLRTVISRLRMHTSSISFQDLKDLPQSNEEIAAKTIAESALQKDDVMILPPIPMELHLTGAKLSKITQAIAYRAIRTNMQTLTRARTKKMLEDIKREVSKVNKSRPSDKHLWLSLRGKDLSKPMRVFL